GIDEAEVVAGPGDGDRGTVDKRVVDRGRPAAPGRLAQHADPVGGRVLAVTGERVLADHTVRQVEVDVRARLPARQLTAVGVGQRQGDHAVGLGRTLVDDQIQRADGRAL